MDGPRQRERRLLEVLAHKFAVLAETPRHVAVNRKQNAVIHRGTENFEVREIGGGVAHTTEDELLRHELEQDLHFGMSSENLLDGGKDLSKDGRCKGHCEDWCYDKENQTRLGGRKACDKGHCRVNDRVNNRTAGAARKLT